MNKTTHLALSAEIGQRILEKRYRREGYITILVTLIGFVLAACCVPASNTVGSVLSTDVHPAPICIFGIIVFFWGCIMIAAHYFRSTEDILREDSSSWNRRSRRRN